MQNIGRVFEEIKVQAQDLVDKVKALIPEGNVRRVIIKDDHGATLIKVPLTVATLGVIAAPVLAAVGAIAASLSHFTVVVERTDRSVAGPAPAAAAATTTGPPTEEQVSMKDTVGQRIDSHGTKVEDLGGIGQHDAKGG